MLKQENNFINFNDEPSPFYIQGVNILVDEGGSPLHHGVFELHHLRHGCQEKVGKTCYDLGRIVLHKRVPKHSMRGQHEY